MRRHAMRPLATHRLVMHLRAIPRNAMHPLAMRLRVMDLRKAAG